MNVREKGIFVIIVVGFISVIIATAFLVKDSNANNEEPYYKEVIVDMDVGTDDAWALKLLVDSEKSLNIKILGVLSSYGNAARNYTISNVFMILELLDRLDIPVYATAYESIIKHEPLEVSLYGIDGFGDTGNYGIDPKIHLLQNESGIQFLYRTVKSKPNKISVLALGPLTTMALTMKTYSDFVENVREIFIMGGNDPNVAETPFRAEFNFRTDPEANDIVLRSAGKPITILTWETSYPPHFNISMDWYRALPLNPINSQFVQFLRRIDNYAYNSRNLTRWNPCDALLVQAFLYPETVDEAEEQYVDMELLRDSSNPKGLLIEAATPESGSLHRILKIVNEDFFKNLILNSVST